jgi:hypothetical protein
MQIFRILGGIALLLVVLALGYIVYATSVTNPRVERELIENPQGERAGRVMMLTLPSGRRIPVNYYQDGGMVFAGADGTWWKEMVGDGDRVSMLIRGEALQGHGRAIEDDPAYTERVFAKLRPNAVKGFGTLIEIKMDEASR